jgi:thioredoxin reductase (NADPH)
VQTSVFDTVIVGAGPAGLSAAITARSFNLKVLLVSNRAESSPLAKARQIDDYPGLKGVSGLELLKAMTNQALAAGAELISERVISIMPMNPGFLLTVGADIIQTRSIILAIGALTARALPGERSYLGRGVSYCATCDGMLYRGQQVVVLGQNDEAESEAEFLAEIGCEVTYISSDSATDLKPAINAKVGRITKILGDKNGVTAVNAHFDGSVDGVTIECRAVFLLRPAIAADALLVGLTMTGGYVDTDVNMKTSISGVFAAGDCTGKPHKIAMAVGQGQLAAFSARAYLEKTVLQGVGEMKTVDLCQQ